MCHLIPVIICSKNHKGTKYRRLSKIRPWAMNLSGCSKRGVGVFWEPSLPKIGPPFESRPTLFESRPTHSLPVLKTDSKRGYPVISNRLIISSTINWRGNRGWLAISNQKSQPFSLSAIYLSQCPSCNITYLSNFKENPWSWTACITPNFYTKDLPLSSEVW